MRPRTVRSHVGWAARGGSTCVWNGRGRVQHPSSRGRSTTAREPQLAALGSWAESALDVGEVRIVQQNLSRVTGHARISFGDQPEVPDLVAPLLGQHNAEVLAAYLGMTPARVREPEASGVPHHGPT